MELIKSKQTAFTLMELMIVLAIVGILAAIAYPSYQDRVIEARRADGKNALLYLAALMEHYYTENYSYTGATPAGVGGGTVSSDGNYNISISNLTATSFTLSATPVPNGPQAADTECGTLTLTNLNIKGPNPSVCW